jgi:predicted lipoprotein with Yx(FWY)xxD motif
MVVGVRVPESSTRGGRTMQLRPFRFMALGVALLGAVAAAGAATKAPTVSATRNGILGELIVVTGGRTLYDTTMDRSGKVACTGSCTARWPPLLISPRLHPLAGTGLAASMLGKVQRPDGHWQVTYHRHPLYLFSGDTRPGQVNGQGLGGDWHALTPSGAAVTASTTGSAGTAVTTPAPTSGSTGDSGATMGSGPPPGANAGMWCAANPKSCVNGVPVPGGQ